METLLEFAHEPYPYRVSRSTVYSTPDIVIARLDGTFQHWSIDVPEPEYQRFIRMLRERMPDTHANRVEWRHQAGEIDMECWTWGRGEIHLRYHYHGSAHYIEIPRALLHRLTDKLGELQAPPTGDESLSEALFGRREMALVAA